MNWPILKALGIHYSDWLVQYTVKSVCASFAENNTLFDNVAEIAEAETSRSKETN